MELPAPPPLPLGQFRVGGFVLPKDIIFFLPRNWVDSKEKFKDSFHAFKTAGMPCLQNIVLPRLSEYSAISDMPTKQGY